MVSQRFIVCRELTEGFPDLTLDAVPIYSKGYVLLADYHAKAIKALLIGLCKEQQAGGAVSYFVLAEYQVKLVGSEQAMAGGKALARWVTGHEVSTATQRPASPES